MTPAEARETIGAAIEAAWEASGAVTETMPLHYSNAKTDPPANAAPFGRLTIRVIDSAKISQGKPGRYRGEGLATVQCFAKLNDGYVQADAMALVVTNAIKTFANSGAGLWFFDIVARDIGVDGSYYQINAQASFRFAETVVS